LRLIKTAMWHVSIISIGKMAVCGKRKRLGRLGRKKASSPITLGQEKNVQLVPGGGTICSFTKHVDLFLKGYRSGGWPPKFRSWFWQVNQISEIHWTENSRFPIELAGGKEGEQKKNHLYLRDIKHRSGEKPRIYPTIDLISREVGQQLLAGPTNQAHRFPLFTLQFGLAKKYNPTPFGSERGGGTPVWGTTPPFRAG